MYLTFDEYIETPSAAQAIQAPVTPPSPPDPVAFAREHLGLEPDPKQIEVLQSKATRGILNCSRQWGKSTIAAAKAVHLAYTQPESLILIASPSKRQSAELLRKMTGMVRKLKIRPRGDGDNPASLLLPNGSRIVALPGTEGTVRGFSGVSMLLIDEAARMDEEACNSLRPVLATVEKGQLLDDEHPLGQARLLLRHLGARRRSAQAAECGARAAKTLPRTPRGASPLCASSSREWMRGAS